MSVLSEQTVLTEGARSGGSEETRPEETGPATRDPAPPSRWRRLLAVVLVLVVVACVALLVWLTTGGRASAGGGLDHLEEREEVMSLTDQFVKRLGTYSPDMLDGSGQMPDYREQVREVITPKFAADFDKEVATAEQLVAQGGITRTADVFATAVSSVDDDSARVLVAGAFTDRYRQGEGEGEGAKARTIDQEPLPFRFTVDLVMIEGEWLVDDFSPVSAPASAGSGGGAADGTTEGSAP
jgi:Mce-associated membrane protein